MRVNSFISHTKKTEYLDWFQLYSEVSSFSEKGIDHLRLTLVLCISTFTQTQRKLNYVDRLNNSMNKCVLLLLLSDSGDLTKKSRLTKLENLD